jgi:hypothetical protein
LRKKNSRQKHTRDQQGHATNRKSLDSRGIGFIQKYEARLEISVGVGPQDKTSYDNTHSKKQEREKVHLEETRNNTSWDNQLKGLVTRTINGRHGIRNRKSADEQLITHFLGTLETAFSPASDTDAHLKESTNIHFIVNIYISKIKQDSNTRQAAKDEDRKQTQKGEEERSRQSVFYKTKE